MNIIRILPKGDGNERAGELPAFLVIPFCDYPCKFFQRFTAQLINALGVIYAVAFSDCLGVGVNMSFGEKEGI